MFGNARLWVKNLGVQHVRQRDRSRSDLRSRHGRARGASGRPREPDRSASCASPSWPSSSFRTCTTRIYLDPDGPQPFQPATTSKAPDVNGSFFNHYQNAVHQQDQQVASMLAPLARDRLRQAHGHRLHERSRRSVSRARPDGPHLQRVRRRDQSARLDRRAARACSTKDESARSCRRSGRVRVPCRHRADHARPDGRVDDPGIAQYKAKMLGTSLLGPSSRRGPLPLTNCAGVWSCAFENWGYMQKNRKLEARSWNEGWQCFDLLNDPFELENLGAQACPDLERLALETFKRLPGTD